ncbi:MAG: EMC3/TMCO1 family protein [Candidatus Methanogranum gryphiswaldense]|nr:MAG: EMC3/TMCO1 family protein [Candidatus Methanogranum sp. U3.2.1]
MPKGTLIGMMIALVVMMVVMMFRDPIGKALNVVFQYIDFGGQWPVFTLIISGIIMITLSTVIRGFITDPIEQAKVQQEQSGFNAELRQARIENNLFKLKKLQEQQPQMMGKSMKMSTDQMKIMPVTMVIILPVYAWVYYFISYTVDPVDLYINMPWGVLNLANSVMGFMPYWIVIYTMISLPIGQLENRFVRYYLLKKRLKELDVVY